MYEQALALCIENTLCWKQKRDYILEITCEPSVRIRLQYTKHIRITLHSILIITGYSVVLCLFPTLKASTRVALFNSEIVFVINYIYQYIFMLQYYLGCLWLLQKCKFTHLITMVMFISKVKVGHFSPLLSGWQATIVIRFYCCKTVTGCFHIVVQVHQLIPRWLLYLIRTFRVPSLWRVCGQGNKQQSDKEFVYYIKIQDYLPSMSKNFQQQ